jgi:membrane-bound metal-dependent hydrolase YbcI (DUF457 family)
MFVGHTAVALAAKSRSPDVSLGMWVAAAFALDLLWPVFLLLGIEKVSIVPGALPFTPLVFDSYPWSHSLVMACIWGAIFGAIARWRGRSVAVAALLFAAVVSHWILDVVSHAPDLPLWPGDSPRIGLGLWQSIPATLLIEGLMFTAGVVLYLRRMQAIDLTARIAFWSFILISAALWASGPWAPPPPDVRTLAWFSIGAWLFVAWAAWADRHRRPRP